MSDVVEQVIQRHPEVKNEGIPEDSTSLSQLMLQNLEESALLESRSTLTAAEILKRNQLRLGANDIGRKLAGADDLTARALNKLKSGDCIQDSSPQT